ncbi:MAG: hypothetical protein JJE17_00355 [Peptostreptococcaceae bacterium]|nr:hypothetical protein [Peptostreptococcaceae bacterium]
MKEELLTHPQLYDEYLLVAPGSDYGRILFQDIDLLTNGHILDYPIDNKSKILRVLHHIHFSFAINRIINLPFKSIWRKYYSLSKIEMVDYKKYCVIFTDISACRTDLKFLSNLSQRDNITLVLINVNVFEKKKKLIDRRLKLFKYIFTFDRDDSEKYGFFYHATNYSKTVVPVTAVEYDAFFVGMGGSRLGIIEAVYNRIIESGGSAEFFVSGVKKAGKKIKGIHYNQWLTYDEVLVHIQKANCIIEIVNNGQVGCTMRTMEALCYGKKLLTNNAFIEKEEYYSPDFISIFSDANHIDINFIKKRPIARNEYSDWFSPVRFINHINSII